MARKHKKTRLSPASWLPYCVAAILPAACGSDDGPTFSADVAPILKDNCVGCHRRAGVAPFPLTDYEDARQHAGAIAESTRTREMPPMPVDNSGKCNTYANARWLTNDEIATLGAWADNGAPEGDVDSLPIVPPAPITLGDPDVIIDPGFEYTPDATLEDDYRCFVLPAPIEERAFVTAYEFVPGDARVVHHAILFQPEDAEAVGSAHELDARESGEGYTCFGGPGVNASPLAMWAPGAGVVHVPAGTGLPLAGQRELVLQVHYNLENGVYPDRSSIKLKLVEDGVTPALFLEVADPDMSLPPGRASVETTEHHEFLPHVSFVAHGAAPHMHTLGRTLNVEARAGSETECLVDVDRWDFHWQNAWWYETPLRLDDVSALSIRCGYDTTTRSATVTWGEGTADEMCISYFYVTSEPKRELSCANTENPLFGSCLDALFSGCYEPDRTGTCSTADGEVTWSDGSKFVGGGTMSGFYGPNDDVPCLAVNSEADGSVYFERTSEHASYVLTTDGATFTCPDGSTFDATTFDMNEFSICRGVACPPEP